MAGGNPYEVVGITPDSQVILDLFLKHYTAKKTYINAIRRLCELTKKYDFTEISYEDFLLVKSSLDNDGSVYKLINTFIKYLYSDNLIKNEFGFDWRGMFLG